VLTRKLAGGMKWCVVVVITVTDGAIQTDKVRATEGGCRFQL
jgi:hypothetical protein